jgi:hypothetical protein
MSDSFPCQYCKECFDKGREYHELYECNRNPNKAFNNLKRSTEESMSELAASKRRITELENTGGANKTIWRIVHNKDAELYKTEQGARTAFRLHREIRESLPEFHSFKESVDIGGNDTIFYYCGIVEYRISLGKAVIHD